jgi:ADP-heptose:LPS heptosyltransferase
VLRRAVAFAGVESGPAHLANAVGTYGVILTGRYEAFEKYITYSGRYATGENAELIQHAGPPADIPVDRVFAALAARLRSARTVELPATSAGPATDAAALAAASTPTEAS